MLRNLAWRRFEILERHFLHTKPTLNPPLVMVARPRTSLINEKVRIQLQGLGPNQTVRLLAKLEENNVKFESTAIYRANATGDIDLEFDASLGGSYTGVDPMGLFWSLTPCPGQGEGIRLVKKDVSAPKCYHLQAIPVSSDVDSDRMVEDGEVLAETTVEKFFQKKGTKRIPVAEGRIKGTLFVPEGSGPFPGLIDLFGGLVSLVETRAALLASHGYATFALAYLYQEDLAQNLFDVELEYIQSATEWLSRQSYVDTERVGVVGLCFGGNLALLLAARTPLIKAVVNINGTSIMPSQETKLHFECPAGNPWPNPDDIYQTQDGIVLRDMWDTHSPHPVPAWQHGANVLFIVGEDDQQVHPKLHRFCRDNWPEEFKDNLEMHFYPGAGHLIEPPYTPHCRVANPTRRRIASIPFIPEKFHDLLMEAGGNPQQHAYAQIDSWKRITEFLGRVLNT